MMVTTVRGTIGGLRGELELDPDQPERASVEVVADMATITTGEPSRDGHLRSADFFDTATYPEARFVSTKIARAASRLQVQGDLTIRGVTRPIVAEAEIGGLWDDPRAGKRAGLSATATIDRRDWGLVWNQPIANGGLLVGENVQLQIELSVVAQERQEASAA
jgi:polyisoprenoid-binding protein YceI